MVLAVRDRLEVDLPRGLRRPEVEHGTGTSGQFAGPGALKANAKNAAPPRKAKATT